MYKNRLKKSHKPIAKLKKGLSQIEGIEPLFQSFFNKSDKDLTTVSDIKAAGLPKLSFQVPEIDNILRGGLRLQGFTEIVGEAGSGKTQLAMNLCCSVQLPRKHGGLGKKALFIGTEEPLSTHRIIDMANHLIKKYKLQDYSVTKFLENIIYIPTFEHDRLFILFNGHIQKLIEDNEIGFIVIDSVAAIYRLHDNYFERATKMRNLVIELRKLSRKYGLAVVCTNQVTGIAGEDEITAPALGFAWANLVTTRLHIIKRKSEMLSDGKIVQKRILKVTLAPNVPEEKAEFYITGNGIQ